jgi:hypothetical protein
LRIFGSGTSRTWTLLRPIQQFARMLFLLGLLIGR